MGHPRRLWVALLTAALLAAVLPAPAGTVAEAVPVEPLADLPVGDAAWSFAGDWDVVRLPDGRPARRAPAGGGRAEVVFAGTGAHLVVYVDGSVSFRYRVDGGTWQEASVRGDGAFRLGVAEGLAEGTHRLELAAAGRDLDLIGLSPWRLRGPAVAALHESFGMVAVTWAPLPRAVAGYEVLRWTGDAAAPEVVAVTGVPRYVDEGPPRGTPLRYAVRARLPGGRLTGQAVAGRVTLPRQGDWMRVSGLRGPAWAEGAAPAPSGRPALRPLAVGDPLAAGDALVVAPGGWAEIELDGGQYLRLGENSRLLLHRHGADPESGRQDTRFMLAAGQVWVNLQKGLAPGSHFEVKTPAAVAAAPGSAWGVRAGDDGTEVWVLGGSVLVTPAAVPPGGGAGMEVRPRQQVRIRRDGQVAWSAFQGAELPEFLQVEALKAAEALAPAIRAELEARAPNQVFQRAIGELFQEQRQRLEAWGRARAELIARGAAAVQGLQAALAGGQAGGPDPAATGAWAAASGQERELWEERLRDLQERQEALLLALTRRRSEALEEQRRSAALAPAPAQQPFGNGAYTVWYYGNRDLAGVRAAESGLTPEPPFLVNLGWWQPLPGNLDPAAFSMRLQGTFTASSWPRHVQVVHKGGLRLSIDGRTIYDGWGLEEGASVLDLRAAGIQGAGTHRVVMEFRSAGRPWLIELQRPGWDQ